MLTDATDEQWFSRSVEPVTREGLLPTLSAADSGVSAARVQWARYRTDRKCAVE